jgi:NAD+ diphosphatase
VLWLTKAQALALVDGKAAGLTAPPPFAIAHSLIRDWAS